MITEKAPGTRREQKAATRSALLVAARGIIADHGLPGLTCRAVTQRAGVASGTFFVHFTDSASLVEALLDDHLAATLDDIESSLPSGASLVGELVHVSLRLYDSYAVQPDLSRAFLTSNLFRSDRHGPTSMRLRAFAGWVGDRAAAAADRGELERAVASRIVGVYLSLYFGLLVAGLRGEVTRSAQQDGLRWALDRLVGTSEPVR